MRFVITLITVVVVACNASLVHAAAEFRSCFEGINMNFVRGFAERQHYISPQVLTANHPALYEVQDMEYIRAPSIH